MKNHEASGVQSQSTSTYLLDNAAPQTPDRFDALSALYDRESLRHLEDRGIGPGWNCLEVGGGGGTIAAWLAARVGPTGHVLVTDLNPRFLDGSKFSNMEIRRHNIVTDPLPDAAFDLIHARLVLSIIPEPEKVLTRLVAALKPGGWLVEEEFDSQSLSYDPLQTPAEVHLKTQTAFSRLLDERGMDRRWGRLVHGRMRAMGLVDVGAEARLSMHHGGSAGTSLKRANFEQLRDALITSGYVTREELEQDIARLDDPEFVTPSSIMWTTWGRRPPAPICN
jgi:ubiquinone/menaquinone biosynthesis C-methylase UbiE